MAGIILGGACEWFYLLITSVSLLTVSRQTSKQVLEVGNRDFYDDFFIPIIISYCLLN